MDLNHARLPIPPHPQRRNSEMIPDRFPLRKPLFSVFPNPGGEVTLLRPFVTSVDSVDFRHLAVVFSNDGLCLAAELFVLTPLAQTLTAGGPFMALNHAPRVLLHPRAAGAVATAQLFAHAAE